MLVVLASWMTALLVLLKSTVARLEGRGDDGVLAEDGRAERETGVGEGAGLGEGEAGGAGLIEDEGAAVGGGPFLVQGEGVVALLGVGEGADLCQGAAGQPDLLEEVAGDGLDEGKVLGAAGDAFNRHWPPRQEVRGIEEHADLEALDLEIGLARLGSRRGGAERLADPVEGKGIRHDGRLS
jgi:hypothetical protein